MNSKIKWKNIELRKELSEETERSYIRRKSLKELENSLILERVEEWLKGEINDNKNQYPQRSDAEEDRILSGRLECAEGLSNLISTWRKELRGLE